MKHIYSTFNKNLLHVSRFNSSSDGASFLKMVEAYFDKAGRHTNIKPDKLNFLKKPDNVVKMTLTLVRGSFPFNCRQWQNRNDPCLSMPAQDI